MDGSGSGAADCIPGSIVWVRRRNGSWWPGKILGPEELSDSHLSSPRAGTPVKLLGREDASIDWYNLERSKRVKAFRCGEFDDCIEKVESTQAVPTKKREKYASREDAILHALELEKEFFRKQGKADIANKVAGSKSSVSAERSFVVSSRMQGNGGQQGENSLSSQIIRRFAKDETPSIASYSQNGRYSNEIIQEDALLEGVPRMRGLQDFGLKIATPKRKLLSSFAGDRFLNQRTNDVHVLRVGDQSTENTSYVDEGEETGRICRAKRTRLVGQNVKVNHHPGGGHWFAASLSPNIAGWNRVPQHSSPSFQAVPHAHAGSYGSLGSHGSYNDGPGLGSSYGSYGDSGNMFAYYSPAGPSAMNLNAQGSGKILGTSPDTRRRMVQLPHGSGLGMSPSGGNFAPLPLGTSPSQFTPPNSYGQFPVGSPGHYGPPSPARGSIQGSPLGKTAAMGQMNRRKGWGYSGSTQVQESSSSMHWQGHLMEGSNISQADYNSQTSNGSLHLHAHSTALSRKQQPGGTGLPVTTNMSGSLRHGSSGQPYQAVGPVNNMVETDSSLPDPGDWDPNYSDELLLQEDGTDMSLAAEFGKGMHLNSTESSLRGVRGNNHVSTSGYGVSTQRQFGPVQMFSHGEVGKLPSHDPHSGHIRGMSKASHLMPEYSYNSISRLGQPAQRVNHGRSASTFSRGSGWHINVQPHNTSFNSEGPRSPGSGSFINVISWGQRTNDAIAGIPPTSRGRKDYGKIT